MKGVPESAAHKKETSQYKLKAMHELMYTNNDRNMGDADFPPREQTAWNKKILQNFLSLVTLDVVINSCAPTERITKNMFNHKSSIGAGLWNSLMTQLNAPAGESRDLVRDCIDPQPNAINYLGLKRDYTAAAVIFTRLVMESVRAKCPDINIDRLVDGSMVNITPATAFGRVKELVLRIKNGGIHDNLAAVLGKGRVGLLIPEAALLLPLIKGTLECREEQINLDAKIDRKSLRSLRNMVLEMNLKDHPVNPRGLKAFNLERKSRQSDWGVKDPNKVVVKRKPRKQKGTTVGNSCERERNSETDHVNCPTGDLKTPPEDMA